MQFLHRYDSEKSPFTLLPEIETKICNHLTNDPWKLNYYQAGGSSKKFEPTNVAIAEESAGNSPTAAWGATGTTSSQRHSVNRLVSNPATPLLCPNEPQWKKIMNPSDFEWRRK